jgi:hypothetical protein
LNARPARFDRAAAAAFVREWNATRRPALSVDALAAWEEAKRDVECSVSAKARARANAGRPLPGWSSEVVERFARVGGLSAADLTGNQAQDDAKNTVAAIWRRRAGWALAGRAAPLDCRLSLRDAGRALGDRTKQAVAKWVATVDVEVARDPELGIRLRELAAGVVSIRRAA